MPQPRPRRAKQIFLETSVGTSQAVQWLRICASTTGDTGSILGQETKIPQAVW